MKKKLFVKISDLTRWFATDVIAYLVVLDVDVNELVKKRGMVPLDTNDMTLVHDALQALDWKSAVEKVLDGIEEAREKEYLHAK